MMSKSNKLIVLLLCYSLKNDDFFDETSKTVYNQFVPEVGMKQQLLAIDFKKLIPSLAYVITLKGICSYNFLNIERNISIIDLNVLEQN
jgi:hypothetical protein